MIKNFTIKHVSTIIGVNGEVDLHSEVDLERLVISNVMRKIEMIWRPSEISLSKSWVTITFEGVKRFIVHAGNCESRSNTVLSDVGYVSAEDFGTVKTFLLEENFDSDCTMVFNFEDESYVLIDARIAHATISSDHVTVARIS